MLLHPAECARILPQLRGGGAPYAEHIETGPSLSQIRCHDFFCVRNIRLRARFTLRLTRFSPDVRMRRSGSGRPLVKRCRSTVASSTMSRGVAPLPTQEISTLRTKNIKEKALPSSRSTVGGVLQQQVRNMCRSARLWRQACIGFEANLQANQDGKLKLSAQEINIAEGGWDIIHLSI